jgi:hypothetical protein
MKKLMALVLSMMSLSVVFAQSHSGRNNQYNNRQSSRDVVLNSRDGYSSNNRYDNTVSYNNGRDEDRRRQESDRINREYDSRINDYRNDRSINARERDYRINQAENERKEKLRSFTGGAVVGAVAGVLLGVLISH